MRFLPSSVPTDTPLDMYDDVRFNAAVMAIVGYIASCGEDWLIEFKAADLQRWLQKHAPDRLHQSFCEILRRKNWSEIYYILPRLHKTGTVVCEERRGHYYVHAARIMPIRLETFLSASR